MNKKAAIIFHSVCGNTMLMAREYEKALRDEGIEVDLFRVEDPLLHQTAELFPLAKELMAKLEEIQPVDVKRLPEYDMMFWGSPTYYGNVSAQMKAFLDSLCDFWLEAKLAGIFLGVFATASTPTGGSDLAMIAMHMSAMHMGMINVSVPTTVAHASMPAYGILHCTGERSAVRPGKEAGEAIGSYIKYFVRKTGEKR